MPPTWIFPAVLNFTVAVPRKSGVLSAAIMSKLKTPPSEPIRGSGSVTAPESTLPRDADVGVPVSKAEIFKIWADPTGADGLSIPVMLKT